MHDEVLGVVPTFLLRLSLLYVDLMILLDLYIDYILINVKWWAYILDYLPLERVEIYQVSCQDKCFPCGGECNNSQNKLGQNRSSLVLYHLITF